MKTVPYNPGMQITNTDQLPRGTGAKYLEVTEPHEPGLPLVAIQWRNTMPKKLERGRTLIVFSKRPRR
jgi:hypothetical protein